MLSAKVQENLAGHGGGARVHDGGARGGGFGAAERASTSTRSVRLARTQAAFSPLMGLMAGVGTLVMLWSAGRA